MNLPDFTLDKIKFGTDKRTLEKAFKLYEDDKVVQVKKGIHSYGGVDDSDGTVGGFIEELVGVLFDFVRLDARCLKSIEKLQNQSTCFDWEEPLLELLEIEENCVNNLYGC
ncbi:hypothetical protein KKD03_04200 [Patescibacteria group bacterium]|nr:hypothetical protein [Patescibacteria group bacterium]